MLPIPTCLSPTPPEVTTSRSHHNQKSPQPDGEKSNDHQQVCDDSSSLANTVNATAAPPVTAKCGRRRRERDAPAGLAA